MSGELQIRYLNGRRLKNALIAAANSIHQQQEYLNQINVFPVPDGDTGTNMVITMQYVLNSAKETQSHSIGEVSQQVADSALLGARGNSGAILAQFFQGFSEQLVGKVRISTVEFAQAIRNAVGRAYEAMVEPKEGTILTVLSEWAERIEEKSKKIHDFSDLLKEGLQTARTSLEETPKKLKVLARAGVVDAGGQGFVHILEGISRFIESGRIENLLDKELMKIEEARHAVLETTDLTYQYCTEMLIEADNIDRKLLRKQLSDLGDSVIVAGSPRRIRVHIHTNKPQDVFSIGTNHGTLQRRKVDDMRQQHNDDFLGTHTGQIALVVDSTCDIPPDYFRNMPIRYVPVWIYFGQTGYVDRVTISAEEFYEKLIHEQEHPTTSQPASADFVKVFSELLPRYERIICMTLSKNVSGTYQAAVTAKKILDTNRVEIIDSGSVSIGFGLVALQALEAIKKQLSYQEVMEEIKNSIDAIRFYIYVDTMTYLIRGGRVGKIRGLAAKLLNLRPILSFQNREIKAIGKVKGREQGIETLLDRIGTDLERGRDNSIVITHSRASDLADQLQDALYRRFERWPEFVIPTSPALGVHAGPGAVGIAMLAR